MSGYKLETLGEVSLLKPFGMFRCYKDGDSFCVAIMEGQVVVTGGFPGVILNCWKFHTVAGAIAWLSIAEMPTLIPAEALKAIREFAALAEERYAGDAHFLAAKEHVASG